MGTVVRKGQYYSVFMVLSLVTAAIILHDQLASAQNISHFVVEEASFTRLCETKNILTVNRKSPAPTIYAHAGETLIMDVENKGNDNLTIFWREGRYLTRHERQLIWLIQPGRKVRQNITISDQGTLWWHAMNIWQSATVHGAIVVYPMPGISYPFPKPHADIPIILGEWWKKDLKEVILEYIASSSNIMHSDAFTINSQPGDFYPCSNNGQLGDNDAQQHKQVVTTGFILLITFLCCTSLFSPTFLGFSPGNINTSGGRKKTVSMGSMTSA
ncbi:laccase-14 [Nicotiana attenuata]|uniref:Laccase-14 n=1 Tax=Nicotiana attenuata TaxID=49451 RepID=A0A1J6JXJ9_NICAT|nr:laccase-14 [Nicotiana attenuata]